MQCLFFVIVAFYKALARLDAGSALRLLQQVRVRPENDASDIVVEALRNDGNALHFVPRDHQTEAVVKAAVSSTPTALRHARRDLAMSLLRQDGALLQHCTEDLRGDDTAVLAAVSSYGRALQFAEESLRCREDIANAALARDPHALAHVCPTHLVMMLTQDGRLLQYAGQAVARNAALVGAAVAQNGMALEFADPSLRDDFATVMASVQQEGQALQYASKHMQGNRDLVLEAVARDPHALAYASAELRGDKDLVHEAIFHDPHALAYASAELRDDEDLVREAIARDPHALAHASKRLRGDIYGVVSAAVNADINAARHATWYAQYRLFGTWIASDSSSDEAESDDEQMRKGGGMHMEIDEDDDW